MKAVITEANTTKMVAEWDALAEVRKSQIETGVDLTYRHFLCPHLLQLCGHLEDLSVLDIGCGVGVFTTELGRAARAVHGIDPSSASISIAVRHNWSPNVTFQTDTIEAAAAAPSNSYDVLFANMTMACAPDILGFLKAAAQMATRSAKLIFSLPHPCYWPTYYGYASLPGFRYDMELTIEAPFRISNYKSGHLTSTHIHRPLEMYINGFCRTGWRIARMIEPMPDSDVSRLHRAPWTYPRYLFGVCELFEP